MSTLGTYYLQYFIPNMGHYDFSSFSININYNKTITKEDIYLNITNLLSKTSDYFGLATYNTESNKIPNITTKVESGFNLNFINNDTLGTTSAYCYLKNNFFNNLLLFCDINEHGRYNLKKTTSPKTMVSLHYKYNFIINPVVNEEIVSIYDANARIISTYPTYIDLSLEESTNIIYIIKSENHIERIRLNPDSNDLNCIETKGDNVNLLNCSITVSHFKNKTSQYFYTYIQDGNGLWQILYSADPIYVKLPEEKTIVLRIKEEYNKHIIKVGRRESILYFVTDYDDSEYHIFDDEVEYKIRFNSVVSDDRGNRLDVSCVIWNPSNEKVRIFCLYEGEMFYDEQNIILNTTSFEYNNYTFVVYSQNSLKVKKLNCNMSFIYASPQTINFEYKEYEEMHYIKLKSVEYQNEKIYLYGENYNSEICDEIKYSDFTIECGISNKKLQKILTVNNEKFKLGIINENYGTYILDNVLDITLNITIYERYKLIIRSFKLLDNISEIDTSVAYETDISYIDDEFVTGRAGECRFRKIKDKPLLILCTFNREGNFSMGNIPIEIYLDNIHYKYIIIIEPLENDEVVYISENGTEIQTFYPNEIDLTFEESFEINYIMNSTHLANNIKLNPDAEDLECTNYIGLKKCIVPIEHFKGMKGGLNYVYTYHSNHMNEQSIYYNAYPLKVTLPPEDYVILRIKAEDNPNKITMGENGTLYFVTNYDDIERNVFDIYDIEDKTSFSMTFLDELKYEHHGRCRLWKPKNDKLRVFCHLNEPFENNTQIISLYETKFNYKNYTVFILPQDTYNVEKLSYNIPFLYADKQEIIIDENTNSYKFKFKKEVYNNELIYIYRGTSYTILDNCRINPKEIICEIEKNKLEENLVLFQDIKFQLAYLRTDFDSLNKITFDSVLDIIIKYEEKEKENIYVQLTGLMNDVSESGVSVAYSTNVSLIPNLYTHLFTIQFYDLYNDKYTDGYCYFKKTTSDNMYFLCDIIGDGYFYVLETENNTEINDASYKYNFVILPIEIYDIIKVSDFGTEIYLTYPNVLNFTIEETATIYYIMPLPFLEITSN